MLKVGHRGARAYEPENTLRSFQKALELGVDAVELDVRRTKDGQIVVMHDADVKRTTNGEGLVSDLTLAEIQKLNMDKNEHAPSLKEALQFLNGKAKVFIELKEENVEQQVLDVIDQVGTEKSVVLVSFLENTLKTVKELNPKVETGLIYAKHKNPLKAALDVNAQWLLALYRFMHTANVEKAHANGLKVLVWTINTAEEAAEMAKKGVDAIASDKPDILQGL
jgi:glycerophosphoryl diester phosphodiesterase